MKEFTSGVNISQGMYKSFQPSFIHRKWLVEDLELINLLSQADRQLGRLDMYSEYIPNIDLFVNLHVVKEATQSTKIEGTKTNMEEALLAKEDIAEEKRDDWEEVQNYVKALNDAVTNLEIIPFSARLIKATHSTLLDGVRGKHKLPGEFRTSQNWIGGASISDARFIPLVHTQVNEYMRDLEKFAHDDEHYFPMLLKVALIHDQFETIHPFLDGNGRVGRLMIILFLVEKKILKRPILYLSDFFERHRTLYYDNLTAVREKSDVLHWCKFFLTGVIEIAKNSIVTFDGILKLQKEIEVKLNTLGSRATNAQLVVNELFQKPVIAINRVKEITKLSPPSAYKILDELERLNILKELTGGKRGKLYLFEQYVDLFK
ncbi:MAG: Fic family protein [Flavobacteriales bacterium]|jgi:Fic family protein